METLAGIADFVEVTRAPRSIVARFRGPALCYTTGHGRRVDLEAVYNNQVCEPAEHAIYVGEYLSTDAEHAAICARVGVDAGRASGMVTAANMNCAGVAERCFEEARVLAVATAGVEGNACRAGDPTSYHEWGGQWRPVGTINVMLFFSHPVAEGELFRVLMTATEAKAAYLADMQVGSRYSQRLATGTGTDQFIVAAPQGEPTITDLGKHSKMGELAALAVRDALAQALRLQNAMTPENQCSVVRIAGRLGVSKEQLIADARAFLGPELHLDELFEANIRVIDTDPPAVAAAAAFTATADMIAAGILPAGQALDVAARGLALAAAGVDVPPVPHTDPSDLPGTLARALAFGWQHKWRSLHESAGLLD